VGGGAKAHIAYMNMRVWLLVALLMGMSAPAGWAVTCAAGMIYVASQTQGGEVDEPTTEDAQNEQAETDGDTLTAAQLAGGGCFTAAQIASVQGAVPATLAVDPDVAGGARLAQGGESGGGDGGSVASEARGGDVAVAGRGEQGGDMLAGGGWGGGERYIGPGSDSDGFKPVEGHPDVIATRYEPEIAGAKGVAMELVDRPDVAAVGDEPVVAGAKGFAMEPVPEADGTVPTKKQMWAQLQARDARNAEAGVELVSYQEPNPNSRAPANPQNADCNAVIGSHGRCAGAHQPATQMVLRQQWPDTVPERQMVALQYCREQNFSAQVCETGMRIMAKENREWDLYVKNPGSSATGLGQYITGTWNNTTRREYGDVMGRFDPEAQLGALFGDVNQGYQEFQQNPGYCQGLDFNACQYIVRHHSGSWNNPDFIATGTAYYNRANEHAAGVYAQTAARLDGVDANQVLAGMNVSAARTTLARDGGASGGVEQVVQPSINGSPAQQVAAMMEARDREMNNLMAVQQMGQLGQQVNRLGGGSAGPGIRNTSMADTAAPTPQPQTFQAKVFDPGTAGAAGGTGVTPANATVPAVPVVPVSPYI
jgi:hypothetical protein